MASPSEYFNLKVLGKVKYKKASIIDAKTKKSIFDDEKEYEYISKWKINGHYAYMINEWDKEHRKKPYVFCDLTVIEI